MRVQHKDTGIEATFVSYNLHGLGEFIAQFDDGDKSSELLREWKPVDGGPWPDEDGVRHDP